jgi:hypothetical protein
VALGGGLMQGWAGRFCQGFIVRRPCNSVRGLIVASELVGLDRLWMILGLHPGGTCYLVGGLPGVGSELVVWEPSSFSR